MKRPLAPLSPAALSLVALVALSTAAPAAHVDPTIAASLAPSPSPSPMPRVDAASSGRVDLLPSSPALRFRTQIAGGIDLPPILDEQGNALVTTGGGHLVQIDAQGREARRVALPNVAIEGPVITASGERAVVTITGELALLSSTGRLRATIPLPARGKDARPSLLADDTGLLFVASGRDVLVFEQGGRLAARASLPGPVAHGLVGSPEGAIALTDAGVVFAIRRSGGVEHLGSLEAGKPSAPPALAGSTLLCPVDDRALVAFRLRTRTSAWVYSSPFGLEASPAIDGSGNAWVSLAGGALAQLGADGKELRRTPISGATLTARPDASASIVTSPLVDRDGRVAFARPGGEVGVIANGNVTLADQRACAEPVGVVASRGAITVACRDGTIAAYDDKRR